jgi:hypothetical protein
MSVYANAANATNEDDRITKQFQKLFEKQGEADDVGETGEAGDADDTSPHQNIPLQFFNITDNIIDRINDKKYLIKISFRELMAYASPIVFNRELEQTKIDELYASITEGYSIPFTIDAIFDPKAKIDEKIIKIINGNHRHGAICKYIAEHDKYFRCNYKVYVWIYVVDECETTNVKQSIELYTKINNHLPFKEPIIIDINIMEFLNKMCRERRFSGLILSNQCQVARQPRINKKELFILLNTNKDILETFVSNYSSNKNNLIITSEILSHFISNINEINHRLSLKGISNLYNETLLAQNKGYYEQAVAIGFFLNLKKSNYPKEVWIKYLNNPTNI